MKGILILLSIFLFACSDKVEKIETPDHADTVSIVRPIPVFSDTTGCSVLKNENDSLKTQLFLAQFKIARVKKYLNICLRDQSQDKFLKGWIRRAIQ